MMSEWESEGGYVPPDDECFACAMVEDIDSHFEAIFNFLELHGFDAEIQLALATVRMNIHRELQ